MVNKKYLLLAGLASALAWQPATAQEGTTETGATYSNRDMTYRGESYDVLDSSYVPDRRMEQHRQFLNNQYSFPAKPRNMWEIGIHAGLYNISGDVPSEFPWHTGFEGGYGIGGHVRKALGYVLSVRGSYTYGRGQGLNFLPAYPVEYLNNPAWNGTNFSGSGGFTPYNAVGQPVFYNYQMESHQANIDLIASLSNIRFHKARTGISFYGFAGLGGLAYQTWVNALNSNFGAYDFQGVINAQGGTITHDERKDVKDALRDLLDDTYETAAESRGGTRRSDIFDSKTAAPVFSFGLGAQFRLSKRINLAIEDRVTTIVGYDEDLLDGQRYATVGFDSDPSPNKDNINYASIGLNFNLGGTGRGVEPLYWLNPLDYSYGELSAPRNMLLPDPVLSDSDGDGIADQFDKCPGTPAGVAVDSHGCPMDTDGDGVPDDRDKQLITPTECQPVDADGVGKCPCNCEGQVVGACSQIGAGSLVFSSGSTRVTPAMQSQLANLAAQMQANPTCRVVIMGNGAGSKAAQQRSWDRVNAVIEYMSERNGIDRNRFIFQYGGTGDENVVMYRVANAGEEGPSNQAPPFPNLRRD